MKIISSTKAFVGLVLLLAGLFVICWGLFSSYKIFTGKSLAPEIFKAETKTTQPSDTKKTLPPEEQMKDLFKEQLKEVLPSGFLPTLLNLVSWSIFVGLLIFGGSKISLLGIKLIK